MSVFNLDNASMMTLAQSSNEAYKKEIPFSHIVLDRFFNHMALRAVIREFPLEGYWKYENHFEKKETFDRIDLVGERTRNFLLELNSSTFINFLESLSGIKGLLPDPHMRGGGLHQTKTGGKLAIHSDFNWNPRLKLYRRVNVLIYLNSAWNPDWGGALELWDDTMSKCEKKIQPFANRMVIFNSTEKSYHGHPHPLACPENVFRRSIAAYYYTAEPPPFFNGNLHSVDYQHLPWESLTPEQETLRKERLKFREST